MIPSVEDIHEALRLGRIIAREADEQLFLIELVERDFRASLSPCPCVATLTTSSDLETPLTPARDTLCA